VIEDFRRNALHGVQCVAGHLQKGLMTAKLCVLAI
jgi:hypothetical protein